MAATADLSPTIIESLYCEALELADEARAIFDLSGRLDLAGEDEDLARVALSCEALANANPADTTKITAPTMLITGDEDGTAPPRNVAAMQGKIVGSTMDILGRTGHWTTFERPNEVSTALLTFLLDV